MIVSILEKFKNPLVIFGILPLLINFFTGNILFLLVCIGPLNLLLLLAKFIQQEKLKINFEKIETFDIGTAYIIMFAVFIMYIFFEPFKYRIELNMILLLIFTWIELKYFKDNIINISALANNRLKIEQEYYQDFIINVYKKLNNCTKNIYVDVSNSLIYLKLNENFHMYKNNTIINGNEYKTQSVINAIKILNTNCDDKDEIKLLEMYLV